MMYENEILIKNIDDEILDILSNMRTGIENLISVIDCDDFDLLEERYNLLSVEIREIELAIEDTSKRYIAFLKTDMTKEDFIAVKKTILSRIEDLEERIVSCSLAVLDFKK